MVRKLAAVFLLSFLIAVFLVSMGLSADKPIKSTQHLRARTYMAIGKSTDAFTGSVSQESGPPTRLDLRASKAFTTNPTEFGETSYDYQHNCTMARQVEHRAGYTGSPYGTYVHSTWMALQDDDESESSPRGVGYQAYSITDCAPLFGSDARMNKARAGYCGIDAYNLNEDSSWAVGYAHEDPTNYAGYFYADFGEFLGIAAYGTFNSDYPLDRFGEYYAGSGENEMIWPKGEWDIDGAEYVFHMVCTEAPPPGMPNGSPSVTSYYRRVGAYGAGAGTWSDQRIIDTCMNISSTVASSPISDKVAVIWFAPAEYKRDSTNEYTAPYRQLGNDVWFAVATDNGADWANNPSNGGAPSIGSTVDWGTYVPHNPLVGGNITRYDTTDVFRGYADMSALWAIGNGSMDYLQIVWAASAWDTTPNEQFAWRRAGTIYHWNQRTDSIREIKRADWFQAAADSYQEVCDVPAWAQDVAKMTIAECEERLYCVFTQFGFDDEPCGVMDTAIGEYGYRQIVGQLYMSVYENQYGAWDRPRILVKDDTLPHGSLPFPGGECVGDEYDWETQTLINDGTCNSEYWASLARYGRMDTCIYDPGNPTPVIDIMYIKDQNPGGCVQPESGIWTLNPVAWYLDSCRLAIPEPAFSVSPPSYGICNNQPIIVMDTTDVKVLNMNLENPGILPNTPVSVVPTYVSGGLGGGQTQVIANPSAGITIPAAGGLVPVTLTVTTTDEDDFVTVYYDIIITHQAGPAPPTQVTVPMCITVANDYIPRENAIIRTDCKRLRIYNNGQMSSNAENASLDFMDVVGGDPDTCSEVYLYDGSKIICRPTPDSVMCWFSVFGQYWGNERAIVQASPLFVDSLTNADYTYATTELMTGDTAIGLIVEYFAPKAPADCSYMLIKQKIFNRTEVTLTGVAWGDALDWDIPGFKIDTSGHGYDANDNYPGQDPSRFLVYQTNHRSTPPPAEHTQYDDCDTTQISHRYGGIAAAQNTGLDQDTLGFLNYLVLENDRYVYPRDPVSNELLPGNPYAPSQLYPLMTETEGYWYSQDPAVDTGQDLNTVVTIGVVDLVPGDTICAVKIVSTSRFDEDAVTLKDNIDKANVFVLNHDEIKCKIDTGGPCDCMPGDANGDGGYAVGDVVYIINYIFKGGPAPTPYATCSGDPAATCSVAIGNAVYLINYIFKGGPPPKTCEEWESTCGPGLYK